MCINCLGYPAGHHTDEKHAARDRDLWGRIHFYASLNRFTADARERGVPLSVLEQYVKDREREYFQRKADDEVGRASTL